LFAESPLNQQFPLFQKHPIRIVYSFLSREKSYCRLSLEEINAMLNRVFWVVITLAIVTMVCGAEAQDTGKKVISTPAAPNAIGPYSQAIRAGKTLYLAGQIAIDPKTNQVLSNESIEEQTRRVLENLTAVLAADGLTMDHVVTTTVFLKDLSEFDKMNAVYATYFKNAPPARATVEVARLPRDVKVEISAIAVAP
jgi:2-iminobutanoate/2-iminopropanoate deaminase